MSIVRNVMRLCFIAVFCNLVSCDSNPQGPQDKAINKINIDYPRLISKRFNLTLDSVGISAMEEIKILAYGFTSRQHVHEAEATELVCKCTEILLDMINKDEEIRPYLIHYPFTSKDVEVAILFSDGGKNCFVPQEFVATASAYRGKLRLCSYDPKKKWFKDISSVPYDQAIKSLKQNGKL